jgi:transporter family-2 protein
VGSFRDFFDQFGGPALAAMVAGAALSVQVIVNSQARIRLQLDHPLQATFINFFGGALVLGVVCTLFRFSWQTLERALAAPWWIWWGCLCGILYITVSVLLSPRLGVALFFTLVIAGQMLSAILLDHFGLFGSEVKPVNLGRIAGVLLVLLGVYVVGMSTRSKPQVEPSVLLVPLDADPNLPNDF